MNRLDEIAKEISELDFSEVDPDNTDEAIFLLAIDLYQATEEEANEIVDIIMEKHINNID